MNIFSKCNHNWKILSETTTESPFEMALKSVGDAANIKLPHQLCRSDRKHIVIASCDKCGQIKKFVEEL